MSSFEQELKKLVGKRVEEVNGHTLYYDDGTSMHLSEYETYIYEPTKKERDEN